MLGRENLEKYDSQKMYKVYDMWPEIAEESYNFEHEKLKFSGINHLVFVGMGGSGAIGDMFASILSKTNLHVSIVKGYILPNTVDSNSLVITTSISGNTVETLTVLKLAKEKNANIIAISSGGKMEEYCKNENIDFRKSTQYHSPRSSFAGFLFSLTKILEPILPIKEKEAGEAIEEMKKLRESVSSKNLSDQNPAINLAKWIDGIPLMYYPWGLNAAAIRFKNSLQENAKLHAITEDVIEACHNGIVSWEKPSEVQPILIQGKDDFVKTKERWDIMKEYFNKNNIDFREIFSVEGNILSKLINLIYFFDYCSIYHAVLNEIDPSPINSIKFVKNRL